MTIRADNLKFLLHTWEMKQEDVYVCGELHLPHGERIQTRINFVSSGKYSTVGEFFTFHVSTKCQISDALGITP